MFTTDHDVGINNVTAINVARYSPDDNKVTALEGGLSGKVNSLLCLPDGSLLVGGDFICSLQKSDASLCQQPMHAVAKWNASESRWTSVAYGGLDGSVRQIKSGIGANSYAVLGTYESTADIETLTPLLPVSGITVTPDANLARFLGCVDVGKEKGYINANQQDIDIELSNLYTLSYVRIWSDKSQKFQLRSGGNTLPLKYLSSDGTGYQSCIDNCTLSGLGRHEMFVFESASALRQLSFSTSGTASVKSIELFHSNGQYCHAYIQSTLLFIYF